MHQYRFWLTSLIGIHDLISAVLTNALVTRAPILLSYLCCAFYHSQKGGRALLVVVPSEEEGIMACLTPKNIPIKRLTINPDKVRK